RRPTAGSGGASTSAGVFNFGALATIAVRIIVLHVDLCDLVQLRLVSRAVRATTGLSVDSVGFAMLHLRRWILCSAPQLDWQSVVRTWRYNRCVVS
ncbi:hypothetical protein HK405_008769, partial [Cladochytrium tenue]